MTPHGRREMTDTGGMDRRTELRDFLQSHRAKLQPEDVGLPAFRGRRRVPGLRREELAQLAGISVDYYVRFEQGRNPHASQAVLDSVARALRLDETEQLHLQNLARPVKARGASAPRPQRVPAGLRQLLNALSDAPAYVLGRRGDILAWNALAAALLGDFGRLAPEERNLARLVFLDETARCLYADWEFKAKGTVGLLRFDAGRHPGDPRLTELIGELSLKSADFRRLWAAQAVEQKTRGRMSFHHQVTGPLHLDFETLRLPDDQDQLLVTYTAKPGSQDITALRLLASWGSEPAPDHTRSR